MALTDKEAEKRSVNNNLTAKLCCRILEIFDENAYI
jgi:hypothetical protein